MAVANNERIQSVSAEALDVIGDGATAASAPNV